MGIPAVAGTAKAVRLPQDRLKGLPQEVQHSAGKKPETGTDSPRRAGPLLTFQSRHLASMIRIGGKEIPSPAAMNQICSIHQALGLLVGAINARCCIVWRGDSPTAGCNVGNASVVRRKMRRRGRQSAS